MTNNIASHLVRVAATCAAITIFALTYAAPKHQVTEVLGVNTQVIGNPDGYIPASYVNIGNPYGLMVLPNGHVWYADYQNFRIVEALQDGTILRSVGREGTAEGEFEERVTSLTRDNAGYLYVLTLCHVYKLDSNGGYIKSWGGCGNTELFNLEGAMGITYDAFSDSLYVSDQYHSRVAHFSLEGDYLGQFGTFGAGNGELHFPFGITTDQYGRIYVVDTENHRVVVFSATGQFIRNIGGVGPGDGLFVFPKGVVVLSDGRIVVTSQNSYTVHTFDANGNFLYVWGEHGANAWQFVGPQGIAKDSSNNLFISDWVFRSVQKFTPEGTFISAIRNSGKTNGKFATPTSLAYDSIGNLYVLDTGDRVQKFTNAGTYLETIIEPGRLYTDSFHIAIDSNDRLYIASGGEVSVFDLSGNLLFAYGSRGAGNGQFDEARGMAFDSIGNVYVTDMANHRVQKFDNAGNYITQWGTRGVADGQFAFVDKIYIDASDTVYVADNPGCEYLPTLNCLESARIQIFNSNGGWIRTIDHTGWGENQYPDMGGFVVDETTGDIFLTARERNAIYHLNNAGVIQGTIGKVGSGIEEFTRPGSIVFNPVTNTLAITDDDNHRVQVLNSGTRIFNLISSADVSRISDRASLVTRYYSPTTPGLNNISARLYFGEYVVSEFNVNLTVERNWQQVNLNTLPGESKALVVNLTPTGAPGISATHSLFIVKEVGQTSVHICPDATTIDEVNITCSNGYDLLEGAASNLSTVVIDSITYWKISGLTGTGALSITPEVTPTPTITVSQTPTVTVTPTATPTITVTSTPTPTVSPTPTATPTPTPSRLPIPVNTLLPVPHLDIPKCPYFETFQSSALIIQKGESVTFTWVAKNTEIVKSILSEKEFNPVDTFTFSPTETTVASFIADNGHCNAKKTITVNVVETLPWANSLAVGAGALVVEAVVATQITAASFGNFWLAAAAFIDRKKRRSWGYVYDAVSKKPVARAVIRLISKDTNEIVDTVVSEANGAFRLTAKVGKFTIKVVHPHYVFPSKVVTSDIDGGYTGIYHGEEIEVKDITASIVLSIPLDPMRLTKKQQEQLRLKEILTAFGGIASNIIMFSGLAYTVYCALIFPHAYNYLMLGIYAIAVSAKIALTVFTPKVQGKVITTDGQAVSGLELGLYDVDFKNILYRTFTSAEGLYSFAVSNTDYKLKIMDSKYTLIQKGQTSTEAVIHKSGSETTRLIAEDLVVKVQ